MMLLPIMINETTIGAIYARRLEPQSAGRKTYTYDWEVTTKGDSVFHAQGTGLKHVRSDGPLVLVQKILEAACVS